MAYKLLYIENDDVTWNYISNCLFDMSWDEYCFDNEQSKENFLFDVNEMIELEDTHQEYRGANPPSFRTKDSAWLPVGIDFEVTETTDHPYTIWHLYRRRFWKRITDYEMMYAP